MDSRHIRRVESDMLTVVIVTVWVAGEIIEISLTYVSSEDPSICAKEVAFVSSGSLLHQADMILTLIAHFGALCLIPFTRSVLIIPVTPSTSLANTSTVTTCGECIFGYLCPKAKANLGHE